MVSAAMAMSAPAPYVEDCPQTWAEITEEVEGNGCRRGGTESNTAPQA